MRGTGEGVFARIGREVWANTRGEMSKSDEALGPR